MIKRGRELLLKSGVFILILASNFSLATIFKVWLLETAFLTVLLLYGTIQKKLISGRYYRYNLMIFSLLMVAALMNFSGEIFQNGEGRFSRLLVVVILNYYMYLDMKNGFKDVRDVSVSFISFGLLMWGIRQVFLHFPEPVLFFSLPPGILFSFALVAAIVRKALKRGGKNV
ncbi:hypothetical protein [uncultured Ilyobacter sp.]|uniref:hypothetical protein n=1 Tax=uncultured Ilyobacter sp. TaxID=544433 RepID=UPI0029C0CAC4|nr:hypothetical protein [uncultured Ilyobacter sp.]